MTRRRAIFANPDPAPVAVLERKLMPGHWKQRVKLAQDMGADVTRDAEAQAFLRRHGYGDL